MKLATIRKMNKRTKKFNTYRHLMIYRRNSDESINTLFSIPLFIV